MARLSLTHPEYIAVHADDEEVTPKNLIQNYIICSLEEKLDTLFSFIKTHLKSKIIVFLSTCSQVRFVYECFRHMQPGITLCALHGKIKQEKRTLIFMDFTRRSSACMFATDIAARGLDFPSVDWVVQVDAPEDCAMYIHRVGRTARFNAGGRALMFLMPSEESAIMSQLKDTGVPIKKLSMNRKHAISVAMKAATLLVTHPECRELAKKAFTSYLKSLQLLPDKDRVDIQALNVDAFAKSLGLPFTPLVPIISNGGIDGRDEIRQKKNVNRKLDKLKAQIKEAKEAKKRLREGGAKETTLPPSEMKNEEELFTVKSVYEWAKRNDIDEVDEPDKPSKKAKVLKIDLEGKAKIKAGALPKKIVFTDDDEVIDPSKLELRPVSEDVDRNRIEDYIERVKQRVDAGRREDTERERSRVQQKHKERKLAKKGPKSEDDMVPVVLGSEPSNDEVMEEAYENGMSDEDTQDEGNQSDDEFDDDVDMDIREQEELALKILERKKVIMNK